MPLPVLDDLGSIAVLVWNQMGGTLDWAAVPLLAALHGVDDLEVLIGWLTSIRDALRAGKDDG